MDYTTKRTEEDIDDQVCQAIDSNGRWPGQTYEEGVRNALEWILGNDDHRPMDD